MKKEITVIMTLLLIIISFTGCFGNLSDDNSGINHYKYENFPKDQGNINSPVSLNVSCRRAMLLQLNNKLSPIIK